MPWIWSSGISGDKKKEFLPELECPWKFDCPSYVSSPGVPLPEPKKPKLRFLSRIQPMVYQYQCKYCGMIFNSGHEAGGKVREEEWGFRKNPALIGGAKVI